MSLYLGIDPGLSGAIALVDDDGRPRMVEHMPLNVRGAGRVKHEVDAGGIAHLLRPHATDVTFGIVESAGARPGQGVASMFSLGHSFGVVTSVLSCLNIAYELLAPTKWKRLAELPATRLLCWRQLAGVGPAPRSPALRITAARRPCLWPCLPCADIAVVNGEQANRTCTHCVLA